MVLDMAGHLDLDCCPWLELREDHGIGPAKAFGCGLLLVRRLG
ncbi:type I-E CRISPR-associated protein Cas6/Cse3/CasE [Methylocaldum gracile subsp. desertum]